MYIDNNFTKEITVTKTVKTTLKERANSTCIVLGESIGAKSQQITANGSGHVKSVLFKFENGSERTYKFKLDSRTKTADQCKILSLTEI
jgi:hypothetical protein|tara:strand:+ start:5210 stop:5476 length:267 start_codon:yes stop_codon:yes gene_type:complete